MAQRSRRSFFSAPQLLISCAIVAPCGFIAYVLLVASAVPRLLSTHSVVPTYAGFYIQYPNLVGKVSNLQCVTNSRDRTDENYSHHCRFNVNSSNIEQFIRESQLLPQDRECGNMDVPHVGRYAPASWEPSGVQEGGECYINDQYRGVTGAYVDQVLLLYSPTSRLAYMQAND
ncbi:hypothetical protein [Trichocoleus sp. FACHB-262]|uniref:hypothetical protein n=1 Tax=Trichocoleus sp. FACHB-262 TaxID=2692869 RepID=UPI001A7E9E50|nr:hypothetical protein [Trichocoleus sp. FACHB-262]